MNTQLTKSELERYKKRFIDLYKHVCSAKEMVRMSRAYDELAKIYEQAKPRKHCPGTVAQPYFLHIHRVILMPARFRILPKIIEFPATIEGFGAHDVGEEVFKTVEEGINWVEDVFGEEAAVIACHMHIPGKHKGMRATPRMREEYYAQIDHCPKCIKERYSHFLDNADIEKIKLVCAIGVIFDNFDAACTIQCLDRDAQERKIKVIQMHCFDWIDSIVAPVYPRQGRVLKRAFGKVLSAHKAGL